MSNQESAAMKHKKLKKEPGANIDRSIRGKRAFEGMEVWIEEVERGECSRA
jgi:hypothetical protein